MESPLNEREELLRLLDALHGDEISAEGLARIDALVVAAISNYAELIFTTCG